MDKLHDIFVFVECIKGYVINDSKFLISIGRQLADNSKGYLKAVVFKADINEIELSNLKHSMCDSIVLIENDVNFYEEDRYVQILCQLCLDYKPNIFLFSSTQFEKSIAAQIAAKIGAGLTADCIDLYMEETKLIQIRPAYSGNLYAEIVCRDQRIQMAVVKCMSHNIKWQSKIVAAEIVSFDFENVNGSIMRLLKEKKRKVGNELDVASIVFGVGRGVTSRDTFNKIKSLAKLVDAKIGFTRAVLENNWANKDCLIGQTGKLLSAHIYMAFGISGATQHIIGISDCDTIIAVNSDKNAKIFEVSDFGIIGDVSEVTDNLIRLLRN